MRNSKGRMSRARWWWWLGRMEEVSDGKMKHLFSFLCSSFFCCSLFLSPFCVCQEQSFITPSLGVQTSVSHSLLSPFPLSFSPHFFSIISFPSLPLSSSESSCDHLLPTSRAVSFVFYQLQSTSLFSLQRENRLSLIPCEKNTANRVTTLLEFWSRENKCSFNAFPSHVLSMCVCVSMCLCVWPFCLYFSSFLLSKRRRFHLLFISLFLPSFVQIKFQARRGIQHARIQSSTQNIEYTDKDKACVSWEEKNDASTIKMMSYS